MAKPKFSCDKCKKKQEELLQFRAYLEDSTEWYCEKCFDLLFSEEYQKQRKEDLKESEEIYGED